MPDDIDPLQLLAEDDERLRHADRLAIVGRLAASIAHELGTPMSIIRLHAQLVATGEVHEASEVKASAGAIVEQCDRSTGLLRRLLDFARPRDAPPLPIELGPLVRSTLDLVAPMARLQGVRLQTPMPGLPGRVMGVRGELQQILLNLVINALQAMPDGGELDVGLAELGQMVQLTVRDEGGGIEGHDLVNIFEPFFTTKEEGVGTGLGLSVVRELVESMGGRIEVESSPNGTTFAVELPRLA